MEGIVRKTLFACVAAGAVLLAGAATAAPNLVTNGGFETNGGNGQLGFNTTATGWTVTPPTPGAGSYDFLWNAGAGPSGTTADTTGANGIASPPPVLLWGPSSGSANGLTLSPDGGAFIGSDPAYGGTITQSISGLTKGAQYILSFDWAAAQQSTKTGATFDAWTVDLGGAATQSTPTTLLPSMGFSGWKTASFTFTADGTTDILSFLATGGPSSAQPPFALLDGVSLVAAPVPEPATWALMLIGVGALGAGLRMRRREVFAAA